MTETAANHIILTGLSKEARDSFDYAREQCEAMGLEILAPIVGYPDERHEIIEVVNKALHEWREAKGGELPAGIDPIQPDEPVAVGAGEYVPDVDAVRPSPEEVAKREREAREREEQARAEAAQEEPVDDGPTAPVPEFRDFTGDTDDDHDPRDDAQTSLEVE